MLKKLDSLLLFVKNIPATSEFYRQLGFEITKETPEMCVASLGYFELHCHDEKTVKYDKDSGVEPKGTGVFVYIAVENIDDYHKSLVEKGLTPSSEPTDQDWGNREFAIKDPDGYKLVMYQTLN